MRNIGISIVMSWMTCLLAGSTAWAEEIVSPIELEALKGMMQEVITENKGLTKRVRELEAEMAKLKVATTKQKQTTEKALTGETTEPGLEVVKEADVEQQLDELATARQEAIERSIALEQERLEQRVKDLEAAQGAQEDATRWVIKDTISTLGSNINEFVVLGGTLEVSPGWGENFTGPSEDTLRLDTAQLDFEIKVNDWMLGSLIIEYDDGRDALFTTTDETEVAVDRINIDTAFFTIGDPQKFPPFAKFGRVILPFGISTGDPVADVLTLDDPLTIEVFETRKTAIGFGLGFPTPALTPTTPPIIAPVVKPMLINPLFSSVSENLGYEPPWRPPSPNFISPTTAPPLFNTGIYFYDGNSDNWSPADHIDATVGFRTRGNCGRSYEDLVDSFLCPWTIDVDLDYNSSVFDSRFLGFEYRSFLDQIGLVPGMAAHVKASLGPVSLVGEWNGAIDQARFVDDLDNFVSIRPAAWQVSLGYQFDWNPWVEVIGAQGTYLALGYSESRDLAGVTRLISGEPNRVGFVPEKRYLLSVGEWVLDGFRVALEYSYNVDYSISAGGTGNTANGLFSTFTYEW